MKYIKMLPAGFLISMVILTGCSHNISPIEPGVRGVVESAPSIKGDSHNLMGLYSFIADPDAGSLVIKPLRDAQMHLNAMKFLEPPVLLYISLEGPPKFNGNILDVDIGVRNPFLGQKIYTGFDVCGIIFTHGSVTGFSDLEIITAGQGDTRLLNADGYTRWWNPAEFPHGGTIFTYNDGLLGTPAEDADFNCTINAYKYFADGLDKDAFLSALDPTDRGVFTSGAKNIRHYKLDMSGGLTFNYAIDACWKMPLGTPPYVVPDDFPPEANRPEPWNISITELENSLYYVDNTYIKGGALKLEVDVWDHFEASHNKVYAESFAGLPCIAALTPVGGGEGYSTYELDFTGEHLTQNGPAELFIAIDSGTTDYGGLLPGKQNYAYFMYDFTIGDVPRGWAVTWGGTAGYEYGSGAAVIPSGDIYVAGGGNGEIDFDPGPGIDFQTSVACFLSKFGPNGNYQWARTEDLPPLIGTSDVVVNSLGEIFICGGSFFGGGFLKKYAQNGDIIWNYGWESGSVCCNEMVVDDLDNLYVTGSCASNADLDPTPGIDQKAHSGQFTLKLDSAGNYQWGRVFHCSWISTGAIYIDTFGSSSVFTCGYFTGTKDFNPGPEVEEHTSNGGSDVYVRKLSSNGTYEWSRIWGGSDDDYSRAIALDNFGNIYVSGDFMETVDFDPGPGEDIHTSEGEEDAFLSKLDPDGNFLWARTWGGDYKPGPGEYLSETCSWVGIDISNDIYACGRWGSTVDFDPGPGVIQLTSLGAHDAFLGKYNPDGNLLWVRTWGGTGGDAGSGGAIDGSGSCFITGYFSDVVDFNPGPGTDVHTSNGFNDIFLVKFAPDGNW